MDHPVIQRGRVLHVARRQQFCRVSGHRRDERALGQRLPRRGQPLLRLLQHLFQPLLMECGARIAQLHPLVFLLQGRHGRKPFRRRPGLDARAAPARVNQPHRHPQLLVQLPPKVIRAGGKPAPAAFGHCFRRARLPGPLNVVLRLRLPALGHLQQPDAGIIGRGNLLLCVPGHPDAHLHVRLSRAQPHLADHHILELDRAGAAHRQGVGAAGLHGGQHRLPFAALVGLDLLAAGRERDRDLLVRLRPSPDHQRLILLQHHVARKHLRQPHFRPRRPRNTARGHEAQHHRTHRPTKSCSSHSCFLLNSLLPIQRPGTRLIAS